MIGYRTGFRVDPRSQEGVIADKSMIPSLDRMPFIDRFLFPETMDKISHDRCVVSPTRGGLGDISVTPEESLPLSVTVAAGKAHRFGSGAADREAKSGSLVGNLIKRTGNGIENLVKNHGNWVTDDLSLIKLLASRPWKP
jgi:hypothetical protein